MRLIAALLACAAAALGQDGIHWPRFRGPNGSGIAEGYATPAGWDVDRGQNIRWKVRIPGLGHSSPVIWGDRVLLTSAVDRRGEAALKTGLYGDIQPVTDEGEQVWTILCVDKRSGRLLWERKAHEGRPRVRRHPKSSHANSTVATDGKYVIALFGSEGLYAYDLEGKLLWKKDLGVLDSGFFVAPDAQWGFGSSPVIFEDLVIVQCDVLTNPFLAAFRLTGGCEVWRTKRDEVPTWSTPAIHGEGGQAQVIVNGYRHIGGYEARTGKPMWRLRGGGDIPIPAPVVADGLVFLTSSHGGSSPIYAIRLSAKGEVAPGGKRSDVAWSLLRDGAYIPTPIVYRGLLYVCRDNGVLSCYRAQSGERLYQQRLGSGRTGFSASLVAADGKLYATSEDGEVFVVRAGETFELLRTNTLSEPCLATPAISEGVLLFRTRNHLIAVGN
jgi:outer membrane protein assembly factor BamB